MGTDKNARIFGDFYPLITKNQSLFAEYTIVLPEEFIKKFKEFSFKATRLLVEHYHFDNEHSMNAYDHLQDLHNDLLTLARKDLSVDVLNTRLSYRLG